MENPDLVSKLERLTPDQFAYIADLAEDALAGGDLLERSNVDGIPADLFRSSTR